MVKVNLDTLLFRLMCLYAVFIPLDAFLEVYFNIETVLKPYRLVAILILLVFSVKSLKVVRKNPHWRSDWLLYAVFIYGLLVSSLRMMFTPFNLAYFISDSIQITLFILIFIVLRYTEISLSRAKTIVKFLVVGICINGFVIFNNFFILKQYGREAGLMDNPNHMALGVIISMVYLITTWSDQNSLSSRLFRIAIALFLGYILIITGSRAAILILGGLGVLSIYYSSVKGKFILVLFVVLGISFITVLKSMEFNQRGPLILLNRFEKKTSSDDPRLLLWGGIIKASEQNYFLGLGIGQFKANFRDYFAEENNDLIKRVINRGYFLSPHSDYFALLAVYGIFGLLAYLLFLVRSSLRILYEFNRSENAAEKNFYQLLLFSLLTISIYGLTADNFNIPLYWLILSLSTRTYPLQNTESHT